MVTNTNAGADIKDGILTINSDRLYNLIDLRNQQGEHLLKLEFQNSEVQAFAFTFG